jgi:hypothetical protein
VPLPIFAAFQLAVGNRVLVLYVSINMRSRHREESQVVALLVEEREAMSKRMEIK